MEKHRILYRIKGTLGSNLPILRYFKKLILEVGIDDEPIKEMSGSGFSAILKELYPDDPTIYKIDADESARNNFMSKTGYWTPYPYSGEVKDADVKRYLSGQWP